MLPDRMSATMVRLSQPGAGSRVPSTTATITQAGMMTARWRRAAPLPALAAGAQRSPAGLARRSGPACPVSPAGRQAGRDGHFEPLAAHLDRDPLARGGGPAAIAIRRRRVLGRRDPGELGLDPPGMHRERRRG